jgi:hypothetical protein
VNTGFCGQITFNFTLFRKKRAKTSWAFQKKARKNILGFSKKSVHKMSWAF